MCSILFNMLLIVIFSRLQWLEYQYLAIPKQTAFESKLIDLRKLLIRG